MEIKVEDYLSHEEIKEICISHIKNKLWCTTDIERILYNISHYCAVDFVNSIITEEMLDKIKMNVLGILNNMTSSTVFYKSYYNSEASLAQKIMEKAVEDNKQIITDKVKQAILSKNYEEPLNDLTCYVTDVVKDILYKGISK